jgi:hypothetical protein
MSRGSSGHSAYRCLDGGGSHTLNNFTMANAPNTPRTLAVASIASTWRASINVCAISRDIASTIKRKNVEYARSNWRKNIAALTAKKPLKWAYPSIPGVIEAGGCEDSDPINRGISNINEAKARRA